MIGTRWIGTRWIGTRWIGTDSIAPIRGSLTRENWVSGRFFSHEAICFFFGHPHRKSVLFCWTSASRMLSTRIGGLFVGGRSTGWTYRRLGGPQIFQKGPNRKFWNPTKSNTDRYRADTGPTQTRYGPVPSPYGTYSDPEDTLKVFIFL